MKRYVFILLGSLLLPFSLRAAKPAPPPDEGLMAKCVETLGGYRKYQRLESLQYQFTEELQTSSGPVSVAGRHAFKIHDPAGFRARLEKHAPSGDTLTIVNSSGTWHWVDGKPVQDPEVLARVRQEAHEEFLWLVSPFALQEAECPAHYTGLSHLGNKLTRRLKIDLKESSLPPLGELALYMDGDTHRIDGLVFKRPGEEEAHTVLLGAYVPTNMFTLPTRRLLLDGQKKKFSDRTLADPQLNTYIDESLFWAPGGGAAASPPDPQAK